MASMLLRSLRIPMIPKLVLPIVKPQLTTVRTMANHRHKKVVKMAKGFRSRANSCFQMAKHRVQKALQYAYRDRKVKKREFRTLWIQRVNAGARMYGLPYSLLIRGMNLSNICLNRKVLSELAITEPLSFRSVVEVVKQHPELSQR